MAEIQRRLGAEAFAPFVVHTVEGEALRVPTREHAAVLEPAGLVFVVSEDGSCETLTTAKIARVINAEEKPVT